jgi:hypothetical protein
MSFSSDWTTKDTNEALLNTLGDEQAAAWARFYAIEVDSRPGELEYDRALAAAKRLDAAIVEIVAAELGGRPKAKPSRRKHDGAHADRRRDAPRS